MGSTTLSSLSACVALEVPAVDRLRQVFLRRLRPELIDVLVGIDHDIPHSTVVALDDLTDIDVVDRIAVLVEHGGPERRVELEALHHLERCRPVRDLTTHG